MSERIKSNQLHKLAREEKDVLKEQVSSNLPFFFWTIINKIVLGYNVNNAGGRCKFSSKKIGRKRENFAEHLGYCRKGIATQTTSYGDA